MVRSPQFDGHPGGTLFLARLRAHAAGLTLCACVAATAGCKGGMPSFFNGFLDPSQVGSYGPFGREGTQGIRGSLTLQDAPAGVAGVTDPQPEDLVPIVEEYKYQIGDAVTVRIYELIQRGTETAVQVTLDETGRISLPLLGRIEVVGLTLPEIEAEIVDQLVRRGLLVEPEVIVDPAVRRGLNYTIYGAISIPNLYPLAQYDLKLLEAINVAGGLLDSVTEVYVVRDQPGPEPVLVSEYTPKPGTTRAGPGGRAVSLSDGYGSGSGQGRILLARAEPGPSSDERLMSDGETANTGSLQHEPEPIPPTPSVPKWVYKNGEWMEVTSEPAPQDDEQPTATLDAPPHGEEARRELIETMVGEPATRPGEEGEAEPPVEAEPLRPTAPQPRWIYYNGKWIEADARTAAPDQAPATAPSDAAERAAEPSIDWSAIAGLAEHRVIKIRADGLREGDPRQNVVVRPGDAIRLAAGEFGEYYLMGQVIRPGAYSLTGRLITLKTAIASAGNLAPLAWPQHCTVYRRLGDREQMIQVDLDAIFAGREEDFFVKKDDLILVGTHPVAPFLAVLRNAFRATYGFGFVYDRNYADIDSYSAKINPDNRLIERSLFPNLFPNTR